MSQGMSQQGDLSAFFAPQGGAFDTNSVAPQEDYQVLPPGDYPVQVEKAEIKATKKGDGHLIELAMVVLDGPAKGRKLWDRMNIDNPSEKAVEISMRKLAALGQAVGLAAVRDTQEFVGKMCLAAVKVKDNSNEIRTYKPFQAVAPDSAATAAFPAPPLQSTPPVPASQQVQTQAPVQQQTNQQRWQEMQSQPLATQPVSPQPMTQAPISTTPVAAPAQTQTTGVPPWKQGPSN